MRFRYLPPQNSVGLGQDLDEPPRFATADKPPIRRHEIAG